MAIQHIPEIINDPTLGVPENEFAIADTWVIDSYTQNAWNGNYINVAEFYSDTSGSQATISLSAIGNVWVSYAGFKDINFIDGTVYCNSSCINRGNTSGISFLNVVDIPELQCDPGAEIEFSILNEYNILDYTANEWNGTSGNLVTFHSDTSGSPAIINISAIGNISVSYMSFKDIIFIGGIVTVRNGSDLGGNSGIVFTSGGETVITTTMNGRTVRILRIYMDGMAYIAYLDGTNLMVDRRYFDSSDNLIGLNSSVA
jgi:hypothetical protein